MKHCLLLLTIAASSLAQSQHGPHVLPVRGVSANHASSLAGATVTDGNGIDYHGGPVMLGTPTVYVIWYGNWAPESPAIPIINNFFQNVGGSPYEGVNATYHDGSGVNVSGSVVFGAQVYDAYSLGPVLTDANIQSIVAAHVGHDLPVDANGLYFVLTSGDVAESGPFGTFGGNYCGWHNQATINGLPIKIIFAGDASLKYPTSCQYQITGPNGSSGGDGMSNVMAHELEEAISDPDVSSGWYDSNGAENADKCAWQRLGTYSAANGALANMKLGGVDYMIQPNWVNAAGGYCSLSNNSALLPKVTIISPTPNQVFICDSVTDTVSVSVVSTAVDYLGNPISSHNRRSFISYQYWCNASHSCGAGAGAGPVVGDYTFTLACNPPGSYDGPIFGVKASAAAVDSFGVWSPWKSVNVVVQEPVVPPPPPPPPPVCVPNNKHAKNCH